MKRVQDLQIAQNQWQDVKIVARTEDDNFFIILGKFRNGDYELGATWAGYPTSHGKLAPIVIPPPFREYILNKLKEQGGVIVESEPLQEAINKIAGN